MSTIRKSASPMGRFAVAVGAAFILGLAPAAFANEAVAVKNALYGAGYNITNVSPKMDDSTRAALTKFQKDHGLQATGNIDEETKKALGMVSVKVAAAASTTAPAKSDVSAPAPEKPAIKEDTVKEKEGGGWSLW